MAKDNLEDNLVIRTMKGDLARLRGELELKSKEKKEVPPPPLGLPTFERRPSTLPAPPKPSVTPPPPSPEAPKEKAIPPSPRPPERRGKPKISEVPKVLEIPKIPKVPKKIPESPRIPEVSKAPEVPKIPKVSKSPKALKIPRTLLLGGIVVALGLATILIYWFLFVIPEPTPTPTPTPTPSPEEELIKPVSLVPVQRQIIIELEEDQDLTTELKKQIEEGVLSGLSQILVYKDSLSPLSLDNVFEEFELTVPQPLINNLDEDYTLLLFAQEEFLTAAGTPSRLGFITEVKSTTVSSQIMRIWEDTMAEDLEGFYLVSRGEQAIEEFSVNTYKDINIRFLNFPLRDITIDYALYPEENWLIFTTSRQFIYRIINLLEEGEIEEL